MKISKLLKNNRWYKYCCNKVVNVMALLGLNSAINQEREQKKNKLNLNIWD